VAGFYVETAGRPHDIARDLHGTETVFPVNVLQSEVDDFSSPQAEPSKLNIPSGVSSMEVTIDISSRARGAGDLP